ncbi:Di-copper centre-containing protein [Conidiobolus coronatus NRRL 28638]|uniref:Di-copper centre-containing protein n=1 Tax=Conidiobolus coronatus (strain ATCC 28846 / CBS 209.66 / NRRL 28638) TaxID=796925 RepID=A0A137PC66_CONC2|nr:Di-copper centre-containing protein [Conidiobolus coronatus NRRL 28638]|eukprot:KXN72573.1 Di-copper centre-containing protein [Conidiobolus coronatus NRRL 28638]
MKFSLAIVASFFINSYTAQNGCPNGVQTRPNYLTMSQTDRDKFHNAIKTLNNGQGNTLYANYTATHYAVGSGAHGSPGFFVWHRHFIRLFEKELQKIDSSIILPYWDWTRDSQAPETSQIFASNNMGPNGGGGSGGCIDSGTFAGWKVQSVNPNCVARWFANGTTIPAWTSPEILDNYLNQNQRYDDLREQVESTGHALVHTGIGGANGDLSFMYSPNDPIFWIHHGFVDYIWWEWQQRHPSAASDYPTDPNTTLLSTYNVPVSTTFDTTSSEYCYTYPRWTVNAPTVDPNTPPTSTSSSTLSSTITSQTPSSTSASQASSSTASISNNPVATSTNDATTKITTKTTIKTTTKATTKGTTISHGTPKAQPTLTNPWGFCPVGKFGMMIGCRKSRRASDLASLAPQVASFPGYVSPTDRTTASKIRVPAQVPSSYLEMNGISADTARRCYLQSAIIACKINLLPDYKPIASL